MKTICIICALFVSSALRTQVIPISEMIEGRNGHVAALAQNDWGVSGALICGGFDGFEVLQSAEWYDPFSDSWSPVGAMAFPRVDFTATSYDGGIFVLVAGGWNGQSENASTTEVYSSATGLFLPGPTMGIGRSFHVASLLENVEGIDYILISGGYDGLVELSECERLNLTTMEWESAGSMNQARSSHSQTVLADGRVMVTGGFNALEGFQLATAEIYDPVTNMWTQVDDMPDARDHHAAALLANGNVLVAGGRRYNSNLNLFEGMTECALFDAETETWSAADDLPTPQSYHSLIAVNDSYCLLPGGVDHTGQDVTTTYVEGTEYLQNSTHWNDAPGLYPAGRFKYAWVQLPQGILVCGGENGDGSGELYTGLVPIVENTERSFSIFPNPATTSSIIQSPVPFTSMIILDLSGRKLFSETGSSRKQSKLDIEGLRNGIYIVQIQTESGVLSNRFVKE